MLIRTQILHYRHCSYRLLSRVRHLCDCGPSFSQGYRSVVSSHLSKSPCFTFRASDPLSSCCIQKETESFIANTSLLYKNSSTRASLLRPLALRANGSSYSSQARVPRPVKLEDSQVSARLSVLVAKLQELGFDGHDCVPGQHNHLSCPMCEDGETAVKSLSLFITPDGNSAVWLCFRGKCGWKGNINAVSDSQSPHRLVNQSADVYKKAKIREITEDMLGLRPLCIELLAYFDARKISKETLQRNGVMQRSSGKEVFIAFPYRRNGVLTSCKYRDVNKRFWQEQGTEKIFYGLDDIRDSSDVIIVEGEIDKLSMEEAGFCNCVSVPDGAPPKVSAKDVPLPEKDKKYKYLWNCKEYLDKVSRIILATDGDPPGQALAEELARRLGRERCWRVKWPKKNELHHFKDANEVLTNLGPAALREVIDTAELYPIRGLFNSKDYFQEIDGYYHRVLGNELGLTTGWSGLDQYYNTYPKNKTLYGESFPHLHAMTEVYGKDYATGKPVGGSVDAIKNMHRETPTEVEIGSSDDKVDDTSGNLTQKVEFAPSSKRIKRERTSRRKGSNMDSVDGSSHVFAPMQEFIKDLGTYLSDMANVMSNTDAREKEVADRERELLEQKDKVLDVLDGLEGLTFDEVISATEILSDAPTKLKIFYKISDDKKVRFVKRILHEKKNGYA